MNETLGTDAGRSVLRMERRLRHPAEKVWRALTEPAELSQWYPLRAGGIDLRVGGAIEFADEDGTRHDAVITDLEPGRVFGFRVAEPGTPGGRERDNLLRFELHPDPRGCLLVLVHTFDDRPAAASYAAGWQTCLDVLVRVLSGEEAGAPDLAGMPSRHEAFVERFGLDLADLRDAPVARIERQLMMRDPGTVWKALVAAAPDDATTIEPNTTLEYPLPTGARLRWELTEGPGGARVHLTHTPHPDQTPAQSATAAQTALHSLLTTLD
ncbi:SRPBCC family protein [Actinophytocola sp.]|uniref:SRPBCC family protein n=1 Tax=Actinophytocola sp. TaxID=1872138 RepID=UPI002D7E8ED9|nr:SRPBCC family protein [Actinophytocola sp.]HET9139027.1 SRPBCC family protein [Actinophytocola sp.]